MLVLALYLLGQLLQSLEPLHLLLQDHIPIGQRRHQPMPGLLERLRTQFRLHVHFANRLEVLLQLFVHREQMLLVTLPRWHLFGAEPIQIGQQPLQFDQRGREGTLLQQRGLLAAPVKQSLRLLTVLVHPSL
uniref:Putative secreted protein n=1 Tax=Anopheles darlingi TaxID=43151 RepID=A0A2M4D4A9_ANODA